MKSSWGKRTSIVTDVVLLVILDSKSWCQSFTRSWCQFRGVSEDTGQVTVSVCVCLGLRGNVHIGADCTVPPHTKVGLMWTNTIYSDLCLDSWGQGYWEASALLLCTTWTIDVYTFYPLFSAPPPPLASLLFYFFYFYKNSISFCCCVWERGNALPTVCSVIASESHWGPEPLLALVLASGKLCICVCKGVCPAASH